MESLSPVAPPKHALAQGVRPFADGTPTFYTKPSAAEALVLKGHKSKRINLWYLEDK